MCALLYYYICIAFSQQFDIFPQQFCCAKKCKMRHLCTSLFVCVCVCVLAFSPKATEQLSKGFEYVWLLLGSLCALSCARRYDKNKPPILPVAYFCSSCSCVFCVCCVCVCLSLLLSRADVPNINYSYNSHALPPSTRSTTGQAVGICAPAAAAATPRPRRLSAGRADVLPECPRTGECFFFVIVFFINFSV